MVLYLLRLPLSDFVFHCFCIVTIKIVFTAIDSLKFTETICLGILCKGQPEVHYSKFSFKQYFPFQHEHLTLDFTKIHEQKFFP